MSVETVYADLVAAAGVTAIVGSGTDAKVFPLIRPQSISPPTVTLQLVSRVPANHLRGNGSLDDDLVQVDSWATTRASVLALSAACRTALEAAGHQMTSQFDNYDPQVDPGLYRATQTYRVWE